MNKKVLAALMVSSSVAIAAPAKFECIVDDAIGFHLNEQSDTWYQTSFLPGERFRLEERAENVYLLRKTEDRRTWQALCDARLDQSEDAFSCRHGTDEVHFNRKTQRFTSFRYYGYWNGSKDSLSISIGKCYAI